MIFQYYGYKKKRNPKYINQNFLKKNVYFFDRKGRKRHTFRTCCTIVYIWYELSPFTTRGALI